MAQRFEDFLRNRALRNYRVLLTEIEGLTPAEVFQHRLANWPDHRWGIGQDGSIAGIVYHVAAWKQMTLPLFGTDGKPQTRDEFDSSAAPDRNDWAAIESWLRRVGTDWNARLIALTNDDFDSMRDWEGTMLPLSSFVVEMMEHDIQHASQIAYLKQCMSAHESI